MIIGDKELISRVIKLISTNNGFSKLFIERANALSIDIEILIHPLDSEIIKELKMIQDFVQYPSNELFQKANQINRLWSMLIEKSIICLRYFDDREPFLKKPNKRPTAYGIEELKKYYKAYDQFEGLLYGSNKLYRDHLIHVFRTWLVGLYLILDPEVCCPSGTQEIRLIDYLMVEGIKENDIEAAINFFEKISIWTIIALCHDLGYPLEKSQQIINKTNEMMNYFIPNPRIWSDISFNGIQDEINQYIIRFMSSKMVEVEGNSEDEKRFLGRIQPKYYIKFTKSLEKYKHGIISAIVIYKILLYFLESDFNMNEDYTFSPEEKRQFYIRREILRAMAAHTCEDIYHMSLTTFSALLINCDELQEWDRKSWNDFYTGIKNESISTEVRSFNSSGIEISQIINIENRNEIRDNVIKGLYNHFEYYKTIFRDGQDTNNRLFSFKKVVNLECSSGTGDEYKYEIVFDINKEDAATFTVCTSKISNVIKRYEAIRDLLVLFKRIDNDKISELEKECSAPEDRMNMLQKINQKSTLDSIFIE